jgi:serine/threonine protein kinase
MAAQHTTLTADIAAVTIPGVTGLELDPANHRIWYGWRDRRRVRALIVDAQRLPISAVSDALARLTSATDHRYANPIRAVQLIDARRLAVLTDHHRLGTLARVVELSGPASMTEAVTLGAEIGEALAHSHRCGVVHGHVGPATTILGDDRHGRLASHGALGEVEMALGAVPTPLGVVPPEGRPSVAADVYALACTVVFAATGSTHPSALPAELRDALGPALDPDPARRPTDADAIALRLRQLAAPPDVLDDLAVRKVPRDRSRRRSLFAVAGVALALVAVGLYAALSVANRPGQDVQSPPSISSTTAAASPESAAAPTPTSASAGPPATATPAPASTVVSVPKVTLQPPQPSSTTAVPATAVPATAAPATAPSATSSAATTTAARTATTARSTGATTPRTSRPSPRTTAPSTLPPDVEHGSD